MRYGAQALGEDAYFDIFQGTDEDLQAEIAKIRRRHPSISIEYDSSGKHDRGWYYDTYRVTSRRRFDPKVQEIADSLHALSSKLLIQLLPGAPPIDPI